MFIFDTNSTSFTIKLASVHLKNKQTSNMIITLHSEKQMNLNLSNEIDK